jgi:peptidoglycan/LPS O-acetylase OafA/YrhL
VSAPAATASIERTTPKRLPVLDGIRAVAIILVIIGHGLWETPWHLSALLFGYTGVAVFFVLSGYLITAVLLAEETATGKVSLRRFYKRRAMRIFPAFYVFLIVLALCARLGILPAPDASTWMASSLYFRNLVGSGWETGHLWTLALEEQFYLFWPSLFVLTPRRFRTVIVTITVLGFCLWRAYALHNGSYSGGIYSRPDLRMDTFLIGAGFALTNKTFVTSYSAPMIVLGLTVWTVLGPAWFITVDTAVAAVLIGGLITWLAKSPECAVAGWLSRPVPVFVGVLSYSIYLWQQLFLGPRSAWWSLPALAAISCGSYYLIERPVLRIRARID